MIARDWIALAGVVTGLLTPIVLAVFAFKLNKRLKHFERTLEEQKRLTDTRFDLYKEIGFQLNDIYAYFNYVGNWKKHKPDDVIELKRTLDRHIFTYRPMFSDQFNRHYDRFILSCFTMYGGWRKDAKLRTSAKHRAEEHASEWQDCFTGEDNKAAIRESYQMLLNCLAVDLGMSATTRKGQL